MLQLFSLPATLRRGGAPPCGAACLSARPRGFALLITIVLVAFLVLILVGLATFTRVETQVASNAANLAKARQNALFALNISIGELQENLGPDRRTSAPAETVLPNPSQPILNQPHWVGAWHGDGGLRNWLVSGNENTPVAAANADPVATGFQFLPSSLLSLADGSPVSGTTVATTNVALTDRSGSRQRAMLLVGPGTVGARPTNFVAAPMRDISSDQVPGMAAGSPASVVGRYAWWVGDEGVKANVALGRTPTPNNGNQTLVRAESMVAPGNAIGLASPRNVDLPGASNASNWLTWDVADIQSVNGRIIQINQLPFAASEVGDSASSMITTMRVDFHRATVESRNVLSDSLKGGLKRDLSLAFELDDTQFGRSEFSQDLTDTTEDALISVSLSTNNVAMKVGGAGYSKQVSSAIKPSFRFPLLGNEKTTGAPLEYVGPSFQLLRDYYNTYKEVDARFGSARISARAAQPSSPLITTGSAFTYLPGGSGAAPASGRGAAAVSLRRVDTGNNPSDVTPEVSQDLLPEVLKRVWIYGLERDTANNSLRLVLYPVVVLHNPYNATLECWGMAWADELRLPGGGNNLGALQQKLGCAVYEQQPANSGNWKGVSSIYRVDALPPIIPGVGDGRANVDYVRILRAHLNPAEPDLSNGETMIPLVISRDGRRGGAPSGSIVFSPGEIKVFSVSGNAATAHESGPIYLTEGLSDHRSAGVYFNLYINTGDGDPPRARLLAPSAQGRARVALKTTRVNAASSFSISNSTRARPRFGIYAIPQDNKAIFESPATYAKSIDLTTNLPLARSTVVSDDWNFAGRYMIGGDENATQIISGAALDERQFIGVAEIARTTIVDQPAPNGSSLAIRYDLFNELNLRARVADPKFSFTQGPTGSRATPDWIASYQPLLDANSVGNYLQVNGSNAFWGESTGPSGRTHLMLYDVPTAPLLSLAAYQHANLLVYHNSPAKAVGNSRASRFVPLTMDWALRSATEPTPRQASPTESDGSWWMLDHSYFLNRGLFDSYFFSGLTPAYDPTTNAALVNVSPTRSLTATLAALPTDPSVLTNPRLRFALPYGGSLTTFATDTDLTAYTGVQNVTTALRPHQTISAYLMQSGALNINSPYPEAWVALIGAARETAIQVRARNGTVSTTGNTASTPFAGQMVAAVSSKAADPAKEEWEGFRNLTDAQIRDLASALAGQVRARVAERGRPFTTLGDFLNRDLKDTTLSSPQGSFNPSHAGAIQTAIDRAGLSAGSGLSDINGGGLNSTVFSAQSIDTAEPDALKIGNTFVVFSNTASPSSTRMGLGGELTQADLLTAIGPHLTARSDTFKIRTYGEVVNPATGEVEAKAWLEAVVQRLPDFVDPSNKPALPPGMAETNWTSTNRDFGRRFRVISFRWLNTDDI